MEWLLGGLLLVAVFVGTTIAKFKVQSAFQGTERWLASWRKQRQQARELERGEVAKTSADVIAKYISSQGNEGLYSIVTVDGCAPLPLLTPRVVPESRQLDLGPDDLLEIVSRQRRDFSVDKRFVRQQLALGRRLTDDPVLYVPPSDKQETPYPLGITGYRGTVTLAERFRRSLGRTTGSERLIIPESFEAAVASPEFVPLVLGSDVVCAFGTTNEDLLVPVHRRSLKTINAPGAFTLTPAYTYEDNCVGTRVSRFGLTAYNFFRELLEEMWDEELVVTASRPRANPDWIFNSTPGERLLEEVSAGRVELHVTGVALDLTHLCFTVALLARFTSASYLDYAMSAPACYEAQRNDGQPPIEFVGLFDDEMADKLRTNMKPTSAFAVDRARAYLRPGC